MGLHRRRIVVDPVCEMDVLSAVAPCISYSGRRIYYFCSPRCKQEFDLSPTFHLDRLARTAAETRRRLVDGRKPGRRHENRRRSMRLRTAMPA
jgi:YHS domain-containing protein